MLPPVGIEPRHPGTTWYLNLDGFKERINRAWFYKEPKVSVLQANATLV